jgi:membrane-associated phospholipid phosphatase
MRARRDGAPSLAVGLLGVAVSALPVRRNRIGRREERVFLAVNRLPDGLHRPAWVVMQLGALGAAPATAALALVVGERRLAARLATSGLTAWVLAKVVKQVIRRGRPSTVIADVRHRGPESSGLGYLSGHAAVSTALVLAALPHLDRRMRWLAVAAAPIVGLSRIFVGAHLPLDVVGGASLGLLVDGASRRLAPGGDPQSS